MITRDATTHGVKDSILQTADALESGDIFFMYYLGHGGSTNDKSADEAGDGKDETLCLYDAQLLDDELYVLWPHFAAGVRILVVANCCHSGSMTRNAVDDDLVVRAIDERSANLLMRADPERYSRVRSGLETGGEISATVKLISGCQDHQQSFEAKSLGHGQMTSALLALMEEGRAQCYADTHATILERMPKFQQPNLFEIGVENPRFDSEAPFTIYGGRHPQYHSVVIAELGY